MRKLFIYIPLCFYFIWDVRPEAGYIPSIYIPLCFYFIREINGSDRIDLLFTFHYASTLSVEWRSCLCSASAFTFHYASTLSKLLAGLLPGWVCIYIPLCFYFILLAQIYNRRCFVIYIPLCFYFIRLRREIPGWRKHIYIPLCFYFIRKGHGTTGSTFNLHSTMLLLYRSSHDPVMYVFCGFTFHYASTLSDDAGYLITGQFNLHSTMLLLYHSI